VGVITRYWYTLQICEKILICESKLAFSDQKGKMASGLRWSHVGRILMPVFCKDYVIHVLVNPDSQYCFYMLYISYLAGQVQYTMILNEDCAYFYNVLLFAVSCFQFSHFVSTSGSIKSCFQWYMQTDDVQEQQVG
jgi:hypothetical protein